MKPPVRFLDEDAVVLRAHVSAHGAEERLHGGPVDVLRPKSERRAQSWPRDIIEAQCRGLGCFVEELAQHTVALQSPLGRPRPAGPARALPLCVVALLRPPRQPGANVPARARLRGVLAPPERAPRIVLLPPLAPDAPEHAPPPPTAAGRARARLSCGETRR